MVQPGGDRSSLGQLRKISGRRNASLLEGYDVVTDRKLIDGLAACQLQSALVSWGVNHGDRSESAFF
jgi:hypothetical protein